MREYCQDEHFKNDKLQIKKQKIETNNNIEEENIEDVVGGSPIRKFLNRNLTMILIEGIKEVTKLKPDDPVRWLGMFLIKKSNEKEENK